MAWRSSGVTNDEMVDNLKRFGVIRSQAVEDGFRAVDRKFFVPPNRLNLAHSDQPIREGKLHISAPHIYGSVLEALDLQPATSMSFLNIGSGTGYLSCLVSEILGPTSSCFCIELFAEAVAHSHTAIEAWKAEQADNHEMAHMQIIHGNGLDIDASQGEAAVGFDRIYIGAAVERKDLPKLADLLRPGGVLVGPVGDELVKVTRISRTSRIEDDSTLTAPRSFRGRMPLLSEGFTTTMLSGVRFSPLLHSPSMPVIIRSRIWEPSLHRYYPDSFKRSCKEILMCSRASLIQTPPPRPTPQNQLNVAAVLPRALWMEVLSYTHRDWFEQPQSEESRLKRQIHHLEAALQRAQEAQQVAEKRLRIAEGERDIYREMARSWQSRIEHVLGESAPAVEMLDGAWVGVMNHHSDDESGQHDDGESEGEEEEMGHDGVEDMEAETETEADDTAAPMDETNESMAISASSVSELVVRSQVRTVSISSSDL